MEFLIKNAGLISGGLGLLSSIVLAAPLVGELRDRRLWELLRDFKAEKQLKPEEQTALASIRNDLLDLRLGNYQLARRITILGLAGLALSFLFLIVDAAMRPTPV